MQRCLALAAALAAFLSTSAAYAQRFGDEGQLVIQDDAKLQIGGTTQNGQNNGAAILLQPAADYFVVHSVSLGAQLLYSDSGGNQVVGVAPRVGYNVTITDDVSFWIRGYVGYAHAWGPGYQNDSIFLEAYAPLLWHPATHFFLGLGPYVTPSFEINRPTFVSFGLATTVGGWFVP
jgi:hypothetical protein